MKTILLATVPFLAALFCPLVGLSQSAVELTINGDFEVGDVSGWDYFPTGGSTFEAIDSPETDVFAGGFSGMIENLAEASNAFVRQADLGVGIIEPMSEVSISFWAKGVGEAGGVQFAEFFSNGQNGVSASEILGGAPLFLTETFELYEFTTTTGSDVTNGVTLQLGATTGANAGTAATFIFDDVSVTTLSDSILGDFNNDGNVNGDDVDFYIGNLDQPATGEFVQLDLNNDSNVTVADHDLHVTTLVTTENGITGALLGDVNLDGTVDVLADAAAMVANLGQGVASRADGDLNADGMVDVLGDATLLVNDLGNSNASMASVATSAVPEPGCLALLTAAAFGVVARRRK